jgi:L-gulono-1,4-lactone dehydrogenase
MAPQWITGGVYAALKRSLMAVIVGSRDLVAPVETLTDVSVIEAMLESSSFETPASPKSLTNSSPSTLRGRATRSLSTYGNVFRFRPLEVLECNSTEEVQSAVYEAARDERNIRVFGNGFSYGREIITRELAIKLKGLNKIRHIDQNAKTVTVDAGVRMADLTSYLAERGFTLPSLPFLSEMTVGGAIATGTHGSSPKWGTISDFARAITVVLASGKLLHVDANSDPDEMRSVAVSVGMLGVIVDVTLRIIEMPYLRFVARKMTLEEFLTHSDDICQDFEHLWCHWHIGSDMITMKGFKATSSVFFSQAYVSRNNAYWANRSTIRSGARKAWRLAQLAQQFGTGRMSGADDKHTIMSMQYGISRSNFVDGVQAIKSSSFYNNNKGRILEIKFLKGSDAAYLGPNYGMDVVLFNTWWKVRNDVRLTIFDGLESVMRDLRGRPHWGKQHRLPDADYLRSVYEKWDAFMAVRDRLDPKRIFVPSEALF